MRKSIYDILGKKINILNEYEKLYDLFNNERIYSYSGRNYSLADLFDLFIVDWEYRATYRNIEEILLDLELDEETTEEVAMQDILYLIELILNVEDFIERKNAVFNKQYFDYDDRNVDLIYKKSNIIAENIEILLKELGYKSYDSTREEILDSTLDNIPIILEKMNYKFENIEDRIILTKRNSDVDSIISKVPKDISVILLEYNDFRIENDLKAKKDILNSLGQYIEPLRKDIKNANSSLEDYIFFCLNKLHIRHNNKSGKDKINYVANIKKKDLINWYDKVYDLILIAIRLVEMPNYFKDFKELKKNIIEDEAVKE